MKLRWRWLVGGLGLLWLLFVAWLTWAGMRTDLHKADCIVVLGARALPDGTPGPSLAARSQRGVELWRQHWAPVLLFTGGRGESGTVEGQVGVNYALAQGVPASALFYEGISHNTRENFLYASELMRSHGWNSCLVVTDPFHEPRSLALAHQFDLIAYPAPTFYGPSWRNWGSWGYYTCRESVSWLKYWTE